MVIQISWEAGRKCQVSFCPQMKLPGQKETMHCHRMPRTSFLSFSAKILWKEWEQVRTLCTGKHCPEAGDEAASDAQPLVLKNAHLELGGSLYWIQCGGALGINVKCP